MALDDQSSKGTKFGAAPDVETHEAGGKKDQEVTVKDEPATPKKPEDEPKKPEATENKADEPKKDEPKKDKPKNEGPNPPKKDDDEDTSSRPSRKVEHDDETKNLLRQIRDGENPNDKRHPLMKKLDQDLKGYSNRTNEFRAGYEFGYKVSYGIVRAVELAIKGAKWAITPKKAEAGVTAVQGSAAGLSGDLEKVLDQAGVSQSKNGADKKGPEQKKDQDKKPEGPKKDEGPLAKSKFGGGVIEGVKSVVEQVKKKDPAKPQQPRKPKGKSFG